MEKPEEYAKLRMGPNDWQTLVRALGPEGAAQALAAKEKKEGTIEFRQGGAALVPGVGMVRNPNLPVGSVPDYGGAGGVDVIGSHQVSGVPGAIQTNETAQTSGREIGQAPYEIVNVQLKGGGTVPMTRAEYLRLLGGQPAPNGPTPLAVTPQSPPVAQPIGGAASIPAGASGPLPSPASNTPPRNYFPPRRNDPFPNAPRAPTYSGLGAPSTQDAVLQKAGADKQVELYTKYGEQSDLADQQLTRVQEALAHINGANMGPWADEATKMQGVLHQIMPSIYAGGAATNSQIFKKNVVNLALQGAKGIYGPRMTTNEVMLQKNEASPSELQTREAATALLKQQQTIAQYNKQRSQDYQTYVAAGHDPLRFEGWYSANHSLQSYALTHDSARQAQLAADRGVNIAPQAFERLTQHPEERELFRRQFGYIPDGY
jgi:hypothetical protein